MNKKVTLSIALSLLMVLSATSAENKRSQLADDIETPDTLLGSDKDKVYGDEGLSLQPGGEQDNAINTPDALERSTQPKQKAISTKDKKIKKLKPKKSTASDKDKIMTDDIETPDPMFESFN